MIFLLGKKAEFYINVVRDLATSTVGFSDSLDPTVWFLLRSLAFSVMFSFFFENEANFTRSFYVNEFCIFRINMKSLFFWGIQLLSIFFRVSVTIVPNCKLFTVCGTHTVWLKSITQVAFLCSKKLLLEAQTLML